MNKIFSIKNIIILLTLIALALFLYLLLKGNIITKLFNNSKNIQSSQNISQNTTTENTINEVNNFFEKAKDIDIFYTSPEEKALYGDFNFKYPATLLIKEDNIKTIGNTKKHFIIIKDRRDNASSNNLIEINLSDSCSVYKNCKDINGVIIGTNSDDKLFLEWYNKIINNFKINEAKPGPNIETTTIPQGSSTKK
jgi:hypothetical protein